MKINLTIQGLAVTVNQGSTILEAALQAGVKIPTLCYHPDLKPFGSCGLCICKQEGSAKILRACATPAAEGMKIITHDRELYTVRRSILELIMSTHPASCLTCIRNNKCELQNLCVEYGIKEQPFEERIPKLPLDHSTKAIVFDPSKCIKCGRCVQVCQTLQGVYALDFMGRGDATMMAPAANLLLKDSPCIKCGQCITHCPVGAIYEEDEGGKFLYATESDKIIVVQMAPSVRVAIGEEFGLKPGEITTGKLYTALRRLGSHYVFDTNFGADMTIMEEGSELIDRIQNNGVLPQITSCCPGWVDYVTKYYPDLIENLSSAKSPMMMQGAITKTYWADKMNIPREKVYSVAIMPCTAKKIEIHRDENMKSSGYDDVDLVLTTRELARIIRQRGIDFVSLPETPVDNPIGGYAGAASIFGVTGGVMEAALRTAYTLVSGKELTDPDMMMVRGSNNFRQGSIDIDGKANVRYAVIHGMANAKDLLEDIRAAKNRGERMPYEFIEVMACQGGCIAGGGQPLGTDNEVRAKRTSGLYTDDINCEKRSSHQNPLVKEIYKEYFDAPLSERAHHLLHTNYKKVDVYKK